MKIRNYSTAIGRGGAVHNHEGAVTYMVNCVIAGNVADGPADDDMGGGVFSGLGSDPAVMDLINCTLTANYAGYRYGGAVNNSTVGGSKLHVRNSIVRGNTDADVHTACTAAVLALKTHVGSLPTGREPALLLTLRPQEP